MRELDILLEKAIKANATDLHIQNNETPRMRVDTQLLPMTGIEPQHMESIIRQILEYTTPEEGKIFAERIANNKEVDCAFTCISGARVRANIYMATGGMACALRIIPLKRYTAEEIGLPFQIHDVCMTRSGLFLVTGANGSGKTTTLAAMIDIINSRRKAHVLTIEEPVEHIIKSKSSLITQREVGLHTQSFYEALRYSVRENPDVVVLGEMRDLNTTRTAIELAETGRLVIATMHSRNAAAAVDRIIGQFDSMEQTQIRSMLSENIIGIISQSLLAKKSGGLITAFEVLFANPAVRNLIRENKPAQIYSVLQTNAQMGMITMEDSLLKLAERGTVSPEEALSKAPFKSNLLSKMKESPYINKKELDKFFYKDL